MGDRSAHDPARPARRRRRSVNVREVLNGIFYVLWTGCQWKALPKDLLPKSTVHDYLELWNWDGTLERIHHTLYVAVREEEGREASPTVAIIDSQTAKGAASYFSSSPNALVVHPLNRGRVRSSRPGFGIGGGVILVAINIERRRNSDFVIYC